MSTTPGSWVCQEMPQSAIASDIARVSPVRSASSRQQRGAGVGDEILAVGGYLGTADRATTMHLQGALLLG